MLAALLISALLPSAFGFPRVRNSSPFGLSHGPLNEWWRCHGDWEKSCVLQEVDLRLDSNLTECGTVRLDWDAADIPEINAITYRLLAIPSWPAAPVDPDEWKTYQANVSLPVQEFITPARSIEWTVNYPAGTEVQFQLDAYSDNVYYKGVNNFTISTGDDHCIPIAHKPVFVTLPTQLYQCEQGMFSWSGGMEPVTAIFTGGHPGWYFVEQPTVQRLGNHSYVEYGNKFPAGAELEFVIQDADGDILAQNSYMIRAGGRKCHINRDYLVHRWWRQPAAIAGLTIGGVAALLLLGVGAFFGGRYYKKRYGGSIALPADEEQETVEPQETVEH